MGAPVYAGPVSRWGSPSFDDAPPLCEDIPPRIRQEPRTVLARGSHGYEKSNYSVLYVHSRPLSSFVHSVAVRCPPDVPQPVDRLASLQADGPDYPAPLPLADGLASDRHPASAEQGGELGGGAGRVASDEPEHPRLGHVPHPLLAPACLADDPPAVDVRLFGPQVGVASQAPADHGAVWLGFQEPRHAPGRLLHKRHDGGRVVTFEQMFDVARLADRPGQRHGVPLPRRQSERPRDGEDQLVDVLGELPCAEVDRQRRHRAHAVAARARGDAALLACDGQQRLVAVVDGGERLFEFALVLWVWLCGLAAGVFGHLFAFPFRAMMVFGCASARLRVGAFLCLLVGDDGGDFVSWDLWDEWCDFVDGVAGVCPVGDEVFHGLFHLVSLWLWMVASACSSVSSLIVPVPFRGMIYGRSSRFCARTARSSRLVLRPRWSGMARRRGSSTTCRR
nr:MAG TPA: hypothetical protein [Caudoviricetes sp.]